MSFELIASRILAPAVGTSIYVWTNIIGVIIAALSLGYWFGGKVADRRVEPLDIVRLLVAAAISILVTLIGTNSVLSMVVSSKFDLRLQGFVASIILFAPTSFLLGTISPYLARLKNVSVTTTGSTIASLSAMNSLGAILGTFTTGFIFFSYIGSRESLIFLSLMLLAVSWLIYPNKELKWRLKASLALAFLIMISIFISEDTANARVDTPSATYQVLDMNYKDKPIRALTTGPNGLQSGMYKDRSSELVFPYTRKMAEIVGTTPNKNSILVLGGGVFTLPQYLASSYPSSNIDVVEIDPELTTISKQYFNYQNPSNVKIISEDARVFLNKNLKSYDIVLVDVYSDTQVPFSLTTLEYVANLRRAVKDKGLVLVNVIGAKNSACVNLLQSVHLSYINYFPNYSVLPLSDQSLQATQNMILVYSPSKIDHLPTSGVYLETDEGIKLRDNYAPTERLKQSCMN